MVYQGKLKYIVVECCGKRSRIFKVSDAGLNEMRGGDTSSRDFGDLAFETLFVTDNADTYRRWKTKGFKAVPLGLGVSDESPYVLEDIEEHTAESLEGVFLRLNGLPWHIAVTERMLIREIALEDVPKLYEIYSDSRVSKFVEPLYEDIDQELEYTSKYIQNCYGFYEFGTWILEDKVTGEVIGRAGLEPLEDRIELGYVIAGDYQGRGLATECCNSIMKIATEILPGETIWARCHIDNVVSKKILDKLGFLVDTEKSDKDTVFFYKEWRE